MLSILQDGQHWVAVTVSKLYIIEWLWSRETQYCVSVFTPLTHWGRETHMCIGKLTIIASDNGLSPERRQAIIWTNAGILLIGPLGTNFNEILIKIHTFSCKKMHLKMSSAKWHPFCLCPNVLNKWIYIYFFFGQIQFYFLMFFPVNVTFLYKTGPINLIFSQNCGYWCPGALAPGHQ